MQLVAGRTTASNIPILVEVKQKQGTYLTPMNQTITQTTSNTQHTLFCYEYTQYKDVYVKSSYKGQSTSTSNNWTNFSPTSTYYYAGTAGTLDADGISEIYILLDNSSVESIKVWGEIAQDEE